MNSGHNEFIALQQRRERLDDLYKGFQDKIVKWDVLHRDAIRFANSCRELMEAANARRKLIFEAEEKLHSQIDAAAALKQMHASEAFALEAQHARLQAQMAEDVTAIQAINARHETLPTQLRTIGEAVLAKRMQLDSAKAKEEQLSGQAALLRTEVAALEDLQAAHPAASETAAMRERKRTIEMKKLLHRCESALPDAKSAVSTLTAALAELQADATRLQERALADLTAKAELKDAWPARTAELQAAAALITFVTLATSSGHRHRAATGLARA
jgi:hypothetical protein